MNEGGAGADECDRGGDSLATAFVRGLAEDQRPDSVVDEDVPVNFLMMFWPPFDR